MIKSSQAGTTLRGAITRLAKKPEQAEKELNRFNIKLSNPDNGNIRPIAEIVTDLSKAFKGLGSQEEKLASASKIFGTNALSGWLTVLDQGPDVLGKFTQSLYDADGAAKQMADIELDTLQGSFKLLQSAAEGLKIRIGTRLSPTMRKFTDDVTASIPELEKAISKGIDIASEKLKIAEQNVNKLKQSMDWKTADTFSDKFSLAWDKVIEEPFHKWWSSSGQSLMADVANKVGAGLGSLYRGGIGLLFGFTDGDGVSVGQSFAEGFLAGFKPEDTARKVIDGFKNIFAHSHFNIFADKEDKSLVSTLISGYVLTKGLKFAGSMAGGVSTGARMIGGLMGGGISPPVAMASPLAQPLVGLGGLGATGMAGAAGAGLSAIAMPAAMTASFVGATGGFVSAVSDFSNATRTQNKKLKRDYTSRGIAKSGMLAGGAGLGAAVGTFLLPGLGTGAGALVGAGLGGLGALIKGNDLGDWISDVSDGTAELDKMAESFKRTKEQAENMKLKDITVDNLVDEYEKLDQKIRNSNLSVDARVQLETQQRDVLRDLAEIYPDLISEYDIQNGRLDNTLSKIQEISKMDREIANAQVASKAIEAEHNLPELAEKLSESKSEEQRLGDDISARALRKEKYTRLYGELDEIQKNINLNIIDDNPVKVEKLKAEFDAKMMEVDKLSNSYGDNMPTINFQSFEAGKRSFENNLQRSYDDLALQKEQTEELNSLINDYYDTMLKNIEITSGLETPILEAAQNYAQLDKEQQQAFDTALVKSRELFKSLGGLAALSPINIDIIENKKLISQTATDRAYYQLTGDTPNNAIDFGSKSLPSGTKFVEENISNYATGGILSKPRFGWMAEAGPEAIIPLAGSHKSRGKELWMQTGELLGFDKALYHATGGIFGSKHLGIIGEAGPEAIIPLSGSHKNRGKDIWQQAGMSLGMFDNQDIPPKRRVQPLYLGSDSENSNSNRNKNISAPISITLGGINITLNGSTDFSNSRSIINAIRAELPEITNELCEQMARMLQQVFSNMTLEA